MKIIIKRVGGEVESINKPFIIYVMNDDGRPVVAEVANEIELPIYISKFKSEYNTTETIIYDI